MKTNTNAAVDSVHNFVGFDGTRYVTTWHDTRTQAERALADHVAAGATGRVFGASVLGEFRVVGYYKATA